MYTGATLPHDRKPSPSDLMVAETLSKGMITRTEGRKLKQLSGIIPALTDYWENPERPLTLNLLSPSMRQS